MCCEELFDFFHFGEKFRRFIYLSAERVIAVGNSRSHLKYFHRRRISINLHAFGIFSNTLSAGRVFIKFCPIKVLKLPRRGNHFRLGSLCGSNINLNRKFCLYKLSSLVLKMSFDSND